MRRSWTGIYWSIGLIILGVVFLLFSMGALAPYTQMVVLGTVTVLALGGVAFLGGALLRHGSWWLVLPGFFLLGIAALVYLSVLAQANGTLQAAVLFLTLGLGYLALFVTDREARWWAWWVGGTFLVLALLLWVGLSFRSPLIGVALLSGLGVVVGLGGVLMPRTMPRWWALMLAVLSLVAAGFILTAVAREQSIWVRIWPVGIIALGLGVLIWTVARWSAGAPERPVMVSPAPVAETPIGSVIPVSGEDTGVPPPISESHPAPSTTSPAAEEQPEEPDISAGESPISDVSSPPPPPRESN